MDAFSPPNEDAETCCWVERIKYGHITIRLARDFTALVVVGKILDIGEIVDITAFYKIHFVW